MRKFLKLMFLIGFILLGERLCLFADGVPAKPTSFNGIALSPYSIQWNWVDNSADETGFKVKTSTDGLRMQLGMNAVDWIEDGLQANTQYARYVLSYNTYGESAKSSIITKYTLANSPTGLSKKVVDVTSVTIQWNNAGATKYSVERTTGTNGIGTWSVVNGNIAGSITSFADTNLLSATTYYYRVKSYNGENIVNPIASDNISVLTLLPQPPTRPGSFYGVALSTYSVQWNWTDANNEAGYRVMSYINNNYHPEVIKTLPADTTYWVEISEANKLLNAHVVAYNAIGEDGSYGANLYTLVRAPTGLRINAVNLTSVTLQWDNVGATIYAVDRAVDSNGQPGEWQIIKSAYPWWDGLTGTSFTDGEVSGETTYWYRIRSYNGDQIANQTPSNAVSVVMSAVPRAPSSFTGVTLSTYSIQWNWLDNTDIETGYRIKASDGRLLKELAANTTHWVETFGQANTQLDRYVVAYNANGESAKSKGNQYTLAYAPTGLNIYGLYLTSAAIQWNDVGATSYQVDRAIDNNGQPGSWQAIRTYHSIFWDTSVHDTSFTDEGLTSGTTFWYRIKSYNGNYLLNEMPSNAVSVSMSILPAQPGSFSGVALSTDSICWNWLDNSNSEIEYRIKTSTGGTLAVLSPNTTYWIEITTQSNKQCSRYVVAYNSYGESTHGDTITQYTLANPPTGLSKYAVYLTSVTLQWDNVGATYYGIDRAPDSNGQAGSWLRINNASTTTFTDIGLSGETTYWYRVKSYNSNRIINETSSNEISIKMLSGLGTPTSFSGVALSTYSIQWNWLDNSNSEIGYRVKSSTGGILRTLPANTNYWVEITTESNKGYTRYVVAYNNNGESLASNSYSRNTLASSPTNLNKYAVYLTSVTLQWDNVGATYYGIDRAPDNNGQAGSWSRINSAVYTTTFTDIGLSGETTYWYRVKSYNANWIINETSSNEISIKMLSISGLRIPTSFSGVALSTYSIQWNWLDNSNGEMGYRVKSSTGGILQSLPANTNYWVEITTESNKKYIRYVVAYNDNGESLPSNTNAEYTFANSPTNLRADAVYLTSATFSWDNVGATRYVVERATESNSQHGQWWRIRDANYNNSDWNWGSCIDGTSFTDTDLQGETTYWYRVKSFNGDPGNYTYHLVHVLNETPSNEVSVAMLSVPRAPTSFNGVALSTYSIQWNWLDNSNNEIGYRVKSSTGGIIRTLPANTNYWVEITTESNKEYIRYVTAYNDKGESLASNSYSRYTLANSPNLTKAAVYITSATIQWNDVGATKYAVERAPDNNGSAGTWQIIDDNVTSTSFTNINLLNGTTYHYRIKSYNGEGTINPVASNEIIVITKVPIISPPLAPTLFDGAVLSTGSIRWSWVDNSADELGFKVKSVDVILKTLPENAVNWTEGGLQPNTQYTRYAVSYNNNGESGSQTVAKYTLANSPTGITKSVFFTSATIHWDDVGAAKYAVERATETNGTIGVWKVINNTVTGTSYTSTSLLAGTTYHYRIKSYNDEYAINPVSSNDISVLTKIPIILPPLAPTLFDGAVLSTGSIRWSWVDNSTDETGFQVKDGDEVLKTLSQNVLNWTEGGLQPNTQYTRYAVSYNNNGDSASNSKSKYTLASSPTGLVKTAVYITSATITWNGVGATRYSVERAGDTNGVIGTWQEINSNVTGTSYTNTGLLSGTTYHYRIKSYNGEGVINPVSSNDISVLTKIPIILPPLAPTLFDGAVLSTGSIRWSWVDNSTDETGFQVKDGDEVLKTLSQNVLNWTEGGLQPNTQYTRHAVSYNNNGDSVSNSKSKYTLASSPTGLVKTAVYITSATITWNGVGATRYSVERAGDTNGVIGTWQEINSNVTGTSYTNTGLLSGTTYHYRIKSYNAEGAINPVASNEISVITINPHSTNPYSTSGIINAVSGGSLVLTTQRGDVIVSVLPGTFFRDVMLTISTSTVLPSNRANIKLSNVCIEITAEGLQPSKDITITMHYLNSDVVGFEESKLVLCRYDEAHARWISLPSTAYPNDNKVVATTDHLSKFAIAQLAGASELSDIKIFPNPFTPKRHTQG